MKQAVKRLRPLFAGLLCVTAFAPAAMTAAEAAGAAASADDPAIHAPHVLANLGETAAMGDPSPLAQDDTLATEAVAVVPQGDPIDRENAALKPVTLSVVNMEIHELLAMFSRSRNLNIVTGEDVSGRVSLDLHEVPFDQALDAAAAMVGCEAVRLDNIYFVSRISGDDKEDGALKQLQTFRLDYARPAEIETVVREMLSKKGRVTSYLPLRTVVVEDRPDVLKRVEKLVRNLDLPPRQVLIEARILEARISKDLRYGIDWSLLFSPGKGNGSVVVEGFTTPAELQREGLIVSWGEGDFQAAIETLEGVEELNTLAAPRLLAVDGTEAQIIIGGQLGFSVVSTIDNTVIQSVEFLDTGTQLKITPIIASDGYVLMNIHPELSSGVIQEGLPSKTTAEVTTSVLIKDGHTLFIGGLIRERKENIRKGIPLLMRIPVLGALFSKTVQSTEKTELITLITPRILQPGEPAEY